MPPCRWEAACAGTRLLGTFQLSKSSPYWWDFAVQTLLLRPSSSDLTAVLGQQPLVHTRGLGFISAWAAHGADGDAAPQLHLRTEWNRTQKKSCCAQNQTWPLQRVKSPVSWCYCDPAAAEPGDMALPSGDWHSLDYYKMPGGMEVEALQDGGPSLQWGGGWAREPWGGKGMCKLGWGLE